MRSNGSRKSAKVSRSKRSETVASDRLTPKQRAFLAAFAQRGVVSLAAKAARVRRQTHYEWLALPIYQEAFREALQAWQENLLAEAYQRAMDRRDRESGPMLRFLLERVGPGEFRGGSMSMASAGMLWAVQTPSEIRLELQRCQQVLDALCEQTTAQEGAGAV